MQIQLIWTDPASGEERQALLAMPVALGRVLAALPASHEGQPVNPLLLEDPAVAEYHALLSVRNDTPLVTTPTGQTVKLNGLPLPMATLLDGDVLEIGPFAMQLRIVAEAAEPVAEEIGETGETGETGEVGETGDAAEIGVGGCDRKVGFLFKRRCGRTSRVGCPYCDQATTTADPYFYDEYTYYPGYGTYGRGYWGHSYYVNRHHYYYDAERGRTDFTEADAAAFEAENDQDYEMDMGAS